MSRLIEITISPTGDNPRLQKRRCWSARPLVASHFVCPTIYRTGHRPSPPQVCILTCKKIAAQSVAFLYWEIDAGMESLFIPYGGAVVCA